MAPRLGVCLTETRDRAACWRRVDVQIPVECSSRRNIIDAVPLEHEVLRHHRVADATKNRSAPGNPRYLKHDAAYSWFRFWSKFLHTSFVTDVHFVWCCAQCPMG